MPTQPTHLGEKTVLTSPPRQAQFVHQLETTSHEMRRYLLKRGLLRVGLLVLAGLGLIALADWTFVLGSVIRAAGLAAIAMAALVWFYRWAIAPRYRFGTQDAADEVESTFPDLGQRLRTALEYVEPTPETAPALPTLVDALTRETDQRTSSLNLDQVIPWRSLVCMGAGIGCVVGLYGWLALINPEVRVAVQRALLLPAQYTQLTVQPGDQTLKAGQDLSIEAVLTGRPVHTAALLHRPKGNNDPWSECSFVDEGVRRGARLTGTFQTKLRDLQNDLEYKVAAGPVESPVYHVKVNRPLRLQGIEASIAPPPYTRRKPSVVHDGNIQVIEGSRVQFRFTLDRMPENAQVRLYTGHKPDQAASSLTLKIDGRNLVGVLPSIDKSLDYELFAEAADGMRLDGAKFHIQVQPDHKPVVRFLKPKEQIEVTPTTEVHLKVEAGDDFGLSKIGIVYQVGDGALQTLYVNDPADQPTSLKTEAILSLEDQQLDFPDSITYYAFVEDNHPLHPQRTTTDLQFIDIRPFKRSYQILEGGGA